VENKDSRREAEGGGSKLCVCVCICVLLVAVCVVSRLRMGGILGPCVLVGPLSQRTPEIRTDVWQMKTLPPETAYVSQRKANASSDCIEIQSRDLIVRSRVSDAQSDCNYTLIFLPN